MRRIAILSVVAALLLSGSVIFAADRLVPSQYPTIQAGIDAAVDGDTVVVGPNTYYENINFGGKSITVTSTDPNNPATTVIDAGGSGTVVTFPDAASANCLLAGFTITGGNASYDGGGIHCANGTITINNCIITGNSAAREGGGIYDDEADLTLHGCTFSRNVASESGGGIVNYYGSLILADCTFSDNVAVALSGGGLYTQWGELTLSDCTFNSNSARVEGGGLATDHKRVTVTNCTFTGNSAGFGGGMNNSHWGATATNCIFTGNSADHGGGIRTNILYLGDLMLSNCTFSDNVANDYGGAVCSQVDGNLMLTNCILWGNSANEGPQIALTGDGTVSISYSCLQGGQLDIYTGPGSTVNWLSANIENDPCLVAGPQGACYLSQTAAGQGTDSPCVNTGSDTATNLGMDVFTTRIDEVSDVGIVDMGYHYPAVRVGGPDVGGDLVVDFADYALFAAGYNENSMTIRRGAVVVDGNLGEWSEGAEWVKLDKVYYASPNDVSEAWFALRWDANTSKIYAAVIVYDGDHVFSDEYMSWNASDRIEIYSQGDAEGGTGWVGDYDVAQQYMVGPNTSGGYWGTWAFGEPLGGEGLEYAVVVDGERIIYEVGVKQFDNYGGLCCGQTIVSDLEVGDVVGLDLIASTRSSEGFGMLSENEMTGKSGDANQFAHYMLSDQAGGPPCFARPSDLDGSCQIDFGDLAVLVYNWLDCYVGPASTPTPPDSSAGADPNLTLVWKAGHGSLSHDVYLGTDANVVDSAVHSSPEFMGTVSEADFDPCQLEFGTDYYWRIDEVGPACVAKGNIWSFTTDDGKASDPNPANGRTLVPLDKVLSWTPGLYASLHDVYFGTDYNDVNDADTTDVLVYMGEQLDSLWDPCGLAASGSERGGGQRRRRRRSGGGKLSKSEHGVQETDDARQGCNDGGYREILWQVSSCEARQ
jgi:hypothetical protein